MNLMELIKRLELLKEVYPNTITELEKIENEIKKIKKVLDEMSQ